MYFKRIAKVSASDIRRDMELQFIKKSSRDGKYLSKYTRFFVSSGAL